MKKGTRKIGTSVKKCREEILHAMSIVKKGNKRTIGAVIGMTSASALSNKNWMEALQELVEEGILRKDGQKYTLLKKVVVEEDVTMATEVVNKEAQKTAEVLYQDLLEAVSAIVEYRVREYSGQTSREITRLTKENKWLQEQLDEVQGVKVDVESGLLGRIFGTSKNNNG